MLNLEMQQQIARDQLRIRALAGAGTYRPSSEDQEVHNTYDFNLLHLPQKLFPHYSRPYRIDFQNKHFMVQLKVSPSYELR